MAESIPSLPVKAFSKQLWVWPIVLFLSIFNVLAQGSTPLQFSRPIYVPELMTNGHSRISFTTGDLNRDGKLDVAVALGNHHNQTNNENFVQVFLGRGGGMFDESGKYRRGLDPTKVTTVPLNNVKTGDLNQDGILDIVTANGEDYSASLFYGVGDGTFASAQNLLAEPPGVDSWDGLSSIEMANFDGDAIPDILTSSPGTWPESRLSFFQNTGTNSFIRQNGAGPSFNFWMMESVDFNGDGKTDLVALGQASSIVTLLGDGVGGFVTNGFYSPQQDTNAFLLSTDFCLSDINGDGLADFVTADNSVPFGGGPQDWEQLHGAIGIFFGRGDGNFEAQPSTLYPGNPNGLVLADFDSDNVKDIAVGNTQGSVSVLLGSTNGAFTFAKSFNHLGFIPYRLGSGDFNNDGKLDIFATGPTKESHFRQGGAAVLLNGIDGEPRLAWNFNLAENQLVLSWPTNVLETILQSTTDLIPPGTWTDSTNPPVIVGGRFTVTNSVSGPGQFYRLRQ